MSTETAIAGDHTITASTNPQASPEEVRKASSGFAYGAVYFRKTNPPEADWERDYETARQDGFTSFRHWFMWSAVEVSRGEFDWSDYDRQLDLAAANGMTTIIAEHIAIAPEWAYRAFPDSRYETVDGDRIDSQMQVSSSIGGTPGLCLDNDDVFEAAGTFLTELVTRYHDHAGTGGYDVWNECNVDPELCYCPGTQAKFRGWLKDKYGDDVAALAKPWGRFYSSWDDVFAPRALGIYGQSLDWLLFRRDRAHELLRWRVEVIKSIDSVHPVTAHGLAGSLGFGIWKGIDDWDAASAVDSFGFTFVASRRGDARWKQPLGVEVVRSASNGKPFWHAEAQAGPLWLQPQVVGRPLDDGRVSTPEDIRYWNLTSMAGGVSGIYYPRWRPLLDGPLFGAFGAYGMDGSRTDRSRAVSEMAQWSTDEANRELWAAKPAPAPLSMLFVPESQAWALVARHDRKPYENAISGAWRGFFDLGVTPDIRKAHQLDGVKVAYLPFPTLLPDESAAAIAEWVHAGGVLISEGTPAWFDQEAHASAHQPGAGLADVFGTGEVVAEFTPDILGDLRVRGAGYYSFGGEVKQQLTPTTGTATGWYDDGSVAVVDNQYGQGRTRLIGTMPGTGYSLHEDEGTRSFFREALRWAGVEPDVSVGDSRLFARLHVGDDADFLWILNHSRSDIDSTVNLGAGRRFSPQTTLNWGDAAHLQHTGGDSGRIRVPRRDGLVIRLPH
jgi:beta-galactosidase